MELDVVLACAAAVVAIYGISHTLKPKIQRFLIALAIVIAAGSVWKAYTDQRDKDLMKAALTGTLDPTAATTSQIYKLVKGQAQKKGFTEVDYMRVGDGMVLYLSDPSRPSETVVPDRLDIALLYAQILMEEGGSNLEKAVWRHIPRLGYRPSEEALVSRFLDQKFGKEDFDQGFSEALYSRLCILGQTAVRQVLRRKLIDCDYDSERGMTITFDVAGQVKELKVPAQFITEQFSPEGTNARVLFSELDKQLRGEVEKIRGEGDK